MTPELDDFYRLLAYWKAVGLTEAEAHAKVEEGMENQLSDEEVRQG